MAFEVRIQSVLTQGLEFHENHYDFKECYEPSRQLRSGGLDLKYRYVIASLRDGKSHTVIPLHMAVVTRVPLESPRALSISESPMKSGGSSN